jgi:excisionase family DNA binding protein
MSPSNSRSSALIEATRSVTVPDICSVEDVAHHLKASHGTVCRWLRDGVIPGRKVGRRWFVTREVLLALVQGKHLRVVSP